MSLEDFLPSESAMSSNGMFSLPGDFQEANGNPSEKNLLSQLMSDDENEEDDDLEEDEMDDSQEDEDADEDGEDSGDDDDDDDEEEEDDEDEGNDENEDDVDEGEEESNIGDVTGDTDVRSQTIQEPDRSAVVENSHQPEAVDCQQADDESSNTIPIPSTKSKKRKRKKAGDGTKKKKSRKSKPSTLRRNIRDIMTEEDLDAQTLEAQKEEAERRKRLMEIKKVLEQRMKEEEKDSQLKTLLQMEDEEKNDVILLDSSDEGRQKMVTKEHDVIELSSSDEDDVVITKDEDNEVEAEDPNNAGSHINDEFNVHDEEGRVVVNIGHPPDEPDIFLFPFIAQNIKRHQIGGVRFLYDNLVESLNRFHKSQGFGCILAHSMGLGKTIQMISFTDIFLRCVKAKTVLLIVPINTLQNWLAEFNMWLPPKDVAGEEGRPFNVYLLNDNFKTTSARAKVIEEWYREGGVLVMGYEMYRLLSSRRGHIAGKLRKPGRKPSSPVVIDVDEDDKNKGLLVGVHEALINPGPDLVVCDEGHRIKNSQAGISQSLKNIRTRRRVVLTGYPLQNNLMEYWCMVDFVRPNYLGTKTEFSNMFERPIINGQCHDSTDGDEKLMRYRAHVLHSLLEGFVQRRGHTVLQQALPPKQEYIFMVRLSPIQRKLYKRFMDSLSVAGFGAWASSNPLKAFAVCCKIWNHPDILYNLINKKNNIADVNDLDIETDGPTKKKSQKSQKTTSKTAQPAESLFPGFPVSDKNQEISYDWVDDLLKDYVPGLLESGGKMVILFQLIEESLAVREKVLVFSQSLFTLDLIEEFLSKRKVPLQGSDENWCRNKNYFRLDGSTSAQEREKMINQFNSDSKCWLFLLSTRAGSLGVNLVGANRVVVVDASWNPCHDCQAICRVYRFGQIRPCFIYRLITDNSMEKKIYDRQVTKQGMSNRVVDEMQVQSHFSRRQVDNLLAYEDQDAAEVDFSNVEDDFYDSVMKNTLRKSGYWVTKKPYEHESLLIDKKELRLTQKEKRLAKQSYDMEKRLNVSYTRPSYAAFYPKGADGQGRRPPIKVITPPSFPQWPSTTYPSRPVASVKPMITTPVPMQPKGSSSGGGNQQFAMGKHKPGVSVHKVVTTTDINLPGTATSTQSGATPEPNRIPAGEQIFIIKTPKGVYIRTGTGKIFAVRAKFPLLQGLTNITAANVSSITATTISSSIAASSADTTTTSSTDSFSSPNSANTNQGSLQDNCLSTSTSDNPADIFDSIYSQSDQDNNVIERNDSTNSLVSHFGVTDMVGNSDSNLCENDSFTNMQTATTRIQEPSQRYQKIAPNLSGLPSQIINNSNIGPLLSNEQLYQSNDQSQNSNSSLNMSQNQSDLSEKDSVAMDSGNSRSGMSPPAMPFLFQNQLIYPPENPQIPNSSLEMGTSANVVPNVTDNSSEDKIGSTVNSSINNTNSMPNMGMPPMQHIPMSMTPGFGFPFAPYPFPMPQPFLMHGGMDPNYMTHLQMPRQMGQGGGYMGGMPPGMGGMGMGNLPPFSSLMGMQPPGMGASPMDIRNKRSDGSTTGQQGNECPGGEQEQT